MLPKPSQLPGNSTTVRRFKNQLLKEFDRQGQRGKRTQEIVLQPSTWGSLTEWMRQLRADKDEQRWVMTVINEDMEGSGWQIERIWSSATGYTDKPCMRVRLRYRAVMDEGLQEAAK